MSEIITRLHTHSDGSHAWERVQDVEQALEDAHALRSQPQKSDWSRHVAEVPCVLLEQILNEAYARGNRTMKLGDPEFMAELNKRIAPGGEWERFRTDAKFNGMLGFGS